VFEGGFIHDQVLIFILEIEQFELEIDISGCVLAIGLFLFFLLFLVDHRLRGLTLGDTFIVHFLKKLRFEFVITLFEIGD
jgi:uncharacterized RDD family membrane protein YckC